jgi:hypothetical protein
MKNAKTLAVGAASAAVLLLGNTSAYAHENPLKHVKTGHVQRSAAMMRLTGHHCGCSSNSNQVGAVNANAPVRVASKGNGGSSEQENSAGAGGSHGSDSNQLVAANVNAPVRVLSPGKDAEQDQQNSSGQGSGSGC